MKIIVGLGNPGKEYEKTKHNVGFLFIEYLERKYNFFVSKKMCDSLIYETIYEGQKIVFVKPQTYMNLSGNAIQKLKKWYKCDSKDIIIIYDDIDISFETIRYRESGSGGSHNGMKNIIECLSTKEIPRIRVGIGGLKHPNDDLKDFVLSSFNKEQIKELEIIFNTVEKKLEEFIAETSKN